MHAIFVAVLIAVQGVQLVRLQYRKTMGPHWKCLQRQPHQRADSSGCPVCTLPKNHAPCVPSNKISDPSLNAVHAFD